MKQIPAPFFLIIVLLYITLLCIFSSSTLYAETLFRYQFKTGDIYTKIATNTQDRYHHENPSISYTQLSDISNAKIIVQSVQDDTATLQYHYQNQTKYTQNNIPYYRNESHATITVTLNTRGIMNVIDNNNAHVPPIRNIPTFPKNAVHIGDTWKATGTHIFDWRQDFNIPEIIIFKPEVTYTYTGQKKYKNSKQLYDIIHISYTVASTIKKYHTAIQPSELGIRIEYDLYWDNKKGREHAIVGTSHIAAVFSDGSNLVFTGKAIEEVQQSTTLTDTAKKTVQERIASLPLKELKNIVVHEDETGIAITLDMIQFPPNSSFLAETEKKKLQLLEPLFKEFSNSKLMVIGHTARIGMNLSDNDELQNQKLSEQRALAVSNYLRERNVRRAEDISYQGMGSQQPQSSNETEHGRQKNRRVEIILLR